MRAIVLIAFGLMLLVLQTAVATLVPMHAVAPNLLLPIAIFLGVSPEVHIVRGATVSFVLGYLLDAFCGTPMGLQTFVLVATFMVARGAGLRLALRGLVFQVILTFVMGLVAGGTVLALRAIFERPAPFGSGDYSQSAWSLLGTAVLTALCAPPLFAATRRIEGWFRDRSEEGVSTP